jgi:predicted MFS family arabinose efflux permease
LPWGFIGVFLNDYFSSEGRMSVEAATAVMGAFSIGAFIGQLAGGWAGQQLYNIGIGAFNNIFIIFLYLLVLLPSKAVLVCSAY